MPEITIDEIIEFFEAHLKWCDDAICSKYTKATIEILKQSKLKIYTQDTIDAIRRDINILQQQSDSHYNELKKLIEANQRKSTYSRTESRIAG